MVRGEDHPLSDTRRPAGNEPLHDQRYPGPPLHPPYPPRCSLQSKKDATLHTLSHWGFSADGWREFVKHSVSGLALPPASSSKPFAFLEVGVGVGAFTRTLLAQYPAATAVGVDLSPAAVKVARAVLPAHRAQVHVSDATNLGCLDDNVFDFVVVPGAICYLSTYAAILAALREIARVARPRARISATMIPQGLRGMASCTTYIPKEWWASEDVRRLGFRVLEMQEMSSWSSADNAIHGEGRYAVFLQLNKITPPPAA